jgi:hypothetical protein
MPSPARARRTRTSLASGWMSNPRPATVTRSRAPRSGETEITRKATEDEGRGVGGVGARATRTGNPCRRALSAGTVTFSDVGVVSRMVAAVPPNAR